MATKFVVQMSRAVVNEQYRSRWRRLETDTTALEKATGCLKSAIEFTDKDPLVAVNDTIHALHHLIASLDPATTDQWRWDVRAVLRGMERHIRRSHHAAAAVAA